MSDNYFGLPETSLLPDRYGGEMMALRTGSLRLRGAQRVLSARRGVDLSIYQLMLVVDISRVKNCSD